MRALQQKKAGFFRFFCGFALDYTRKSRLFYYYLSIYLHLYILYYDWKGTWVWADIFLRDAPTSTRAGKGGSHGRNISWDFFDATERSRRWGSQGRVVPTVATYPGIFLMPRNDPGSQGKPGKGDSHGCYTREAARSSGDPSVQPRSPAPAIWPYLE